jgi:leucyl aminopeptidase
MMFARSGIVTVQGPRPSEIAADLLLVPIFEDDGREALAKFDVGTGGHLARALASGEIQGKPYQIFTTAIVAPEWRARRLAAIGAGPVDAYTLERARRLATAGAWAARQARTGRIAFVDRLDPEAGRVQAIAEGLMLADFEPGAYKKDREAVALESATLVLAREPDAGMRRAAIRGALLGAATNQARALANEPGNRLTPTLFAEQAAQIAAGSPLTIEILDEHAIARLNMGLLLGVARGSAEPPRLVVLRYEPPDAPPTPFLGLIGKGITFDSGGISIKPADGMDRMKDDMSGGAAVVCAMRAIANLGAPIRVLGVVPAAENMPGGRAIKPGDVLTAASGTTVEVNNTDAEGRLLLGDALWYARRLGATHLVDVATLTGACVVALGKITSGLFGTPASWVDVVRRSADRAGDRVWPLPLFDEYDEQLRSEIADVINSPGRPAGAITAAMFLKRFAGEGPWAHLDIAGTAWTEDPKPYQPKGPTGVAVRTLAEVALGAADWTVPARAGTG